MAPSTASRNRFIIPRGWQDFLGPSLSTLVKVGQDLVNDESFRKIVVDLAPQPINNLARIQDENVLGRRERPTVTLSPAEKAVKMLGFPPAREARELETLSRRGNEAAYVQKERQKVVDRLVADPTDTDALREAQALGISGSMVSAERKRKQQTALERQGPLLPRVLRYKEASSQ